jgi:hypothetical protein
MIAVDHYINRRTLTESIQRFPETLERTFKRRPSSNTPFLLRARADSIISHRWFALG